MKYDIITFGSGTRDVYIIYKGFMVREEKKFIARKGLCLSLGAKIEADNILFRAGGGATNAAATFSSQGFKVAWCGMVGKDVGGREIVRQLKQRGIYTGFIFQTDKKPTNYSVILCAKQDRTILVYRGASSELSAKDIPWKKLQAKWFYLAPLSDKLASLFPRLVNYAKNRGIKVAVNPGNTQLRQPVRILRPILSKTDVLFLNQEEASVLTRRSYKSDRAILKEIARFCRGIVVVTKGPLGAVATDGRKIFSIPALRGVKVVDRTGAGDAFCSGFLAEFIRTNDIVTSLQFGIANSAACISKWGAKEGLLKKGQKWEKVQVTKTALS